MKKTIIILAAIVMATVSCQKENSREFGSNAPGKGKLTATFVRSKVSYTETAGGNLQPAWELGDKIIGFDEAGNTYTLTVASVSEDTATLSGTVPDGAIHLIYKSGAKASDIKAKRLVIKYNAQAGDNTMPAVMLADGTVTDGRCNFVFSNAGAIIGINAVKGGLVMPSDEEEEEEEDEEEEEEEERENEVPIGPISKVTIEGASLSEATVALSNGVLSLEAIGNIRDDISTVTLSGIEVVDKEGTLNAPIFIAVPAGAIINRIKVDRYSYTIPSGEAVEAGQYLCVKDQYLNRLWTYTVHYLRVEDNERILPDKVVDCEPGEFVTIFAGPVPGYHLVDDDDDEIVDFRIEEDNTEFTFYYEPDKRF